MSKSFEPNPLHAVPSRARCSQRLPALEHPDRFAIRYVSANGNIRWRCDWINVSALCAGEYFGLENIDDGIWTIYFGALKLGRLLEGFMPIEDACANLKRYR